MVKIKRFGDAWLVALTLIAVLGAAEGFCGQAGAPGTETKPTALVHLDPLRDGQYAIVVEKETQQLTLYGFENGRIRQIERMQCSTGKVRGAKQVSGDQKTPVGAYFFTRKIAARDLAPLYGNGAFPLDYPNFKDRQAGRNGYAIWLHGTNRPLKDRDSNGCIALRNDDLDRLKQYINLQRTPIVIQDRLEYDTMAEADRQADQVKRFLAMWNTALQQGSYHEYLSFYAPEYLPDISWWPQWRSARQAGGNPHPVPAGSSIEGTLVLRDKGAYVVLFDRYVQVAGKRRLVGSQKLYLEPRRDGLRIVGDVYQEAATGLDAKGSRLLLAGVQELRRTAGVSGDRIPDLLSGWLAAWSGKDLKRYGSYYHRQFASQGMNKRQWLAHKKRLNKKYNSISVTATDVRIDKGRDRSTVTFVQNYRSNVYRALGIKKLILKREGDRWKIFRESWKKRSSG